MPTNRTRFLGAVGLAVTVGLASSGATFASGTGSHHAVASAQANSKIAFVAGVVKQHPRGYFLQTELYVMNADGSGKRRLVRDASSPVWSPDGLKLAFEKRLGPKIGQCGVCTTEIFVVNADGGGHRSLTRNLGGGVPAWSPDGRMIAFSTVGQNRSIPNIYVMNADGSGQRRVTQDAAYASAPAWSADGRRIAFARVVGGVGNPEVFVVNVDGSGQQQLTRDPGPDDDPAWSPDGQTIAFMRYVPKARRPKGVGWQKELYVMNTDGSGQRKLARMSDSDGSFSGSPDGRRIAFVSKRDGNDEVYVINVDGSGLRNLTRNPARDGHPKWSPDGRTIGFVSKRGGNRDIYVMNADGSRQRNLTRGIDQQAYGIAWSPVRTN